MYSPRLSPSRSRFLALVAWVTSVYTLISIILINIGGVSFPLPTALNPITRLGNPGFEILQWFFDGDERDPSIPNFYHYRLSLNRLCAVNPTKQRGNGMCYNSGPLGSFYLNQHSPDRYIEAEKAYDEVVGKIDFLTPFVFYILAGVVCLLSVMLLPSLVVSEGAGIPTRLQAVARTRGATLVLLTAVLHTVASSTLTYSTLHLAKWMQYVPQVSHIWKGDAPLAMTWTATALLILTALAMQEDALNARRAWRLHERRNSMGVPTVAGGSVTFHDSGDSNAGLASGYGLFRRFRDDEYESGSFRSPDPFRRTGEEKTSASSDGSEGLRASDWRSDGGRSRGSSWLDGGRSRSGDRRGAEASAGSGSASTSSIIGSGAGR